MITTKIPAMSLFYWTSLGTYIHTSRERSLWAMQLEQYFCMVWNRCGMLYEECAISYWYAI